MCCQHICGACFSQLDQNYLVLTGTSNSYAPMHPPPSHSKFAPYTIIPPCTVIGIPRNFEPILLFRPVLLLEFQEISTLYFYYNLYNYLEWRSTCSHLPTLTTVVYMYQNPPPHTHTQTLKKNHPPNIRDLFWTILVHC